MTNVISNEDCQTSDLENENSVDADSSLQLPLDTSMCMKFTGYYNGIGVEIRSLDQMALIHHMGCFGKGTESRSKPQVVKNDGNPPIMRKRQFIKRNYWYKKFAASQKNNDLDSFFKDVNDLVAKIVHDTKNQTGKDIIDLISSDDDDDMSKDSETNNQTEFDNTDQQNLVVVVPNSDSEDDYFGNLKPQCCVNKTELLEKLMLCLEEAFFLVYGLGCLQIVNKEDNVMNIEECWKVFSENNDDFLEKYVVYHYFRSKGYIVKPGIKFGGDYLLYRDGPGIRHAEYVVVVNYGIKNFNIIHLFGHVRMAKTTVKEVIIAEVLKSTKKDIKMPQDLCEFSVRELIITGNIPVIINNDNDMD